MRLLKRGLVSREQSGMRFRSRPRGGETRFGFQRAKGRDGEFCESGQLDVSRGGDDDVVGCIPPAEALAHGGAGEAFHALTRPQDACAQGMAAPEVLGEEFVRHGFGIVFFHANLFEDDVALLGDVFFGEERAQDQIGEHVERQRQVLVEHLGTEANHFLGGEGVQVAADRVHLAGDLLRGAARGAFKDHVLNEMGDAAQPGGFASRSGAQPEAD